MRKGLSSYEDTLTQQVEEERARRECQSQTDRPASTFCCARAVETVIPTLGSAATADAVPEPSIRGLSLHSHMGLTDAYEGGVCTRH